MLACVHGLVTPRRCRCRSAVLRYVQKGDLPQRPAPLPQSPPARIRRTSCGRGSPREDAHRAWWQLPGIDAGSAVSGPRPG